MPLPPDGAARFRFHLQTGLGAEELGLLWRDLYARADACAFLSWDWIGSWIACLADPPLVLVGEAGGALVLLGLLVPRRRREAGGLVRADGLWLHATGEAASDVIAIEYNGFLVDRIFAGPAETAAVSWLLGERIGGRHIDELDVKAMGASRAKHHCPDGTLVRELSRKPSWRVDLDAVRAAGGDYVATLSANTRQQIRRSMRLYEREGPLAATRAPDASTALGWLEELAALHQRQWQAKGAPGGWAYPFFAEFQRRLVAASVPNGTAEIVRVFAGDAPIGFVYNLISGDHVMAFVTGFRMEADARLKPGLVSHALCIQRHADEGRRLYDFLAGNYRYKASLGQPGPEFVHLHVQRRTAMARFEMGLRFLRDRVRGVQPAR